MRGLCFWGNEMRRVRTPRDIYHGQEPCEGLLLPPEVARQIEAEQAAAAEKEREQKAEKERSMDKGLVERLDRMGKNSSASDQKANSVNWKEPFAKRANRFRVLQRKQV